MCGIYASTLIYDSRLVEQKLRRIAHRGPDSSNFRFYDGLILGQNRLSIIDLSSRSDQPFTYLHLHLVYNGEIYNYRELKTDLERQGFIFKTTSDTEVICASYLAYGEECVNHFNGMFAFVVYDEDKKALFGARDRLGKKPFYYRWFDGKIEIASQVSQIAIGNNLSINDDALCKYLAWGYIPDPLSIYQGVYKLPAGHSMSFNLQSNKLTIDSYWDLSHVSSNVQLTYQDAQEKLNELICKSVKQRMISDVPLGVFLSGGIDSSLVAAVAQSVSSHPINSFSISFDEKAYDESMYAEAVAKSLGTNHTTINCSIAEGMDMIENISYYYDEPFADSSSIPSMLLSKHTKKYVTVALSGDGGDESFLGYDRYDWIKRASRIFSLPKWVRSTSTILSILNNSRLNQIIDGLSLATIEDAYVYMMSPARDWHNQLNRARDVAYLDYLKSNKDLLERVSDFDIKAYMNGDINTKVDRASMAFSLEVRAPLMDYKIVEFSRQIPTQFKYNNGKKKLILKDVLYTYLDKKLFDRPKSGFGVPIRYWFQNELKEMVLDHLNPSTLRQNPFIDERKVISNIYNHISGKENNETMIWRLLMYEIWKNNA